MTSSGTRKIEIVTPRPHRSLEVAAADPHPSLLPILPPFAVIAVTVSNVMARGKFHGPRDAAQGNDSATRALWRRAERGRPLGYCR